MKRMKYYGLSALFLIISLMGSVPVRSQPVKLRKLERFELQSSAVIGETGKTLSSPGYKSKVYWFPVKVPSTVLTGLVANKIYPDPYIGMNNMLIPDASDEFNKQYNLEQYSFLPGQPNPWKKAYWYRTTFKVPDSDKGKFQQLIFKGINYRADVWLNGVQVADSAEMAGMFAEFNLDVTPEVKAGEMNYLAVKIYPLDYPGLPAQEQLKALGDFFANGGPTGDIGKNVTMLCSVGWDWIPPVRDRNMGIWQPVYLRTSGKVTVDRPHVVTTLPSLPDTSKAEISVTLDLSNHSDAPVSGNLSVLISPETFKGDNIEFSRPVTIGKGSTLTLHLDPSKIRQLKIRNPRLWWPNGYGTPDLYNLKLSFSDNQGISDEQNIVFGIRTVSSTTTDVKGKSLRRDFYVNGRRVNLVGGAWVPDMMLQRDSARFANELKLCQNANANLVRIWGGGITPPDVFFDMADRFGLLVWSDFWVTGDTQGEFKGSPDWPLESRVFINNMTSTIYRIRNHPSLLVWTGGNEGHARKELYDAMRDSVITLDGTRPFIPSSSGFAKLPKGWKGSWPDDKQSGVYSGGPYTWQDTHHYYELADKAKDWVFKDETGIPSQPPYNTLHKIIPDLVWDQSLPFPLNNTWGYHDAATGNGRYDVYYKETVARYGAPESMEDFSEKTQLMNAQGYQGIFESAGHRLNDNGGVMLWKLNAAFPSVMWQIYDWYLEPNAGYYFMQTACEPVHVQFNYDDSAVAVINRTYHEVHGLTATASVYDLNGKLLDQQIGKLDAGTYSTHELFRLSKTLSGSNGVTFILLKLENEKGDIISYNTYWLAPSNDYRTLKNMPGSEIKATYLGVEHKGKQIKWKLNVTNPSSQVAFFVRPQLMQKGEEIMPSFWSAGYFTLAPNESIDLTVGVPEDHADGTDVTFKLSGWNVKVQEITVE